MTKRLIRDIQPSQRIRAKIEARTKPKPQKEDTLVQSQPARKKPSGGARSSHVGGSWKTGFIIALVVLAGGMFVWSLFKTAVIVVTPRSQNLDLRNLSLLLATSGEASDGIFHEITIEEKATISLVATETQYQEEKASGIITIFNNHGTSSQRLLEETRFETPEGKIYKLAKGAGVTVPGGTMQGGKLVPGSLDITVYADEAGESYNIGFSDFTIPGFKGTPREKTFYARSKTEMTGGFKGERVLLSEDTIAMHEKKIETMLREQLDRQLGSMVSRDIFVLSKDDSFITLSPVERINVPGKELQLQQSGTLSVPVVRRDDFGSLLADKSLPEQQKGVGRVVNLDDLNYTFGSVDEDSDSLRVSISGSGMLVWNINEGEIASSLEKIKKKDVPNLLKNNASILQAEVSVRPFWLSRLPKKEKIHVIIHNPQI
jgi:hypothetical protein